MKDIRIPQAIKLVEGILTKSELPDSSIMIRNDNTVVIIVKDTVMYTVSLKNLPVDNAIAFKYNNIIGNDECIAEGYLLMNMECTYIDYCHDNDLPLIRFANAREDEAFEKLLKMKAADGVQFYKIFDDHRAYHIPVFSGFPNLNKDDKIDIEIYQGPSEYLAVKLIIFKKKINRYITMSYQMLDLLL